jgi:cysteinyl-tRNA synthetase
VRIHNTLTRKKEELVPLTPGEVRMYVCGVTVYDRPHIGHARSAIVFDVIRRYLAFRGYRVTFVRNFTDVDDKIIRRANADGVPAREVSERYVREYQVDMASIGVLPGDVEPKATEHIPQMVALIERLIGGGFAYVVDGDVYFEVRTFPEYGKLSGKNLEELLVGARVEVDERKRDPRDFALWKSAKPGEPSWPSPWGPGRPGWHIECSAMAMQYLGDSFDLHGGGEDLIFPHHECEIAQAEAATGRPFVRTWAHNGFVNMASEKMSKSLGNTLTIKDIVTRHDPEALRLWMLGTHYRGPVEYAEDRIREAARALARFRALIDEADRLAPAGGGSRYRADSGAGQLDAAVAAIADRELAGTVRARADAFVAAMDDDFNTPAALATLFDLSHDLHRQRDGVSRGDSSKESFVAGVDVLLRLGQRGLGLFERPAVVTGPSDEARVAAEALVAEREAARKRRDYKRADEIRAQVQALGATIVDTASGPQLKWGGT